MTLLWYSHTSYIGIISHSYTADAIVGNCCHFSSAPRTMTIENRKKDFKEWDPFSGVTYVLTSLNFKACRFAYNEEEATSLSVFYCLRFSLSLSRFQAIFVSFVTISVVQCYKAMSLVRILSWQGLRNVMEAFAYTFLVSNSSTQHSI